jgi:hypothetical protein
LRTVLAFTNVVHLFPDKLASLCTGGLTLFFVMFGAFDDLLFWHAFLLEFHRDAGQIADERGFSFG